MRHDEKYVCSDENEVLVKKALPDRVLGLSACNWRQGEAEGKVW
jgi:hypothetical protein